MGVNICYECSMNQSRNFTFKFGFCLILPWRPDFKPKLIDKPFYCKCVCVVHHFFVKLCSVIRLFCEMLATRGVGRGLGETTLEMTLNRLFYRFLSRTSLISVAVEQSHISPHHSAHLVRVPCSLVHHWIFLFVSHSLFHFEPPFMPASKGKM